MDIIVTFFPAVFPLLLSLFLRRVGFRKLLKRLLRCKVAGGRRNDLFRKIAGRG